MKKNIKLLSVVGARPQFVKLAPIVRAIERQENCSHFIVHTGQHYDESMSASFFEQLRIPSPDVNLAVGSAGHAAQTAEMLTGLEDVFLREKPAVVLTYGDTNSTLAATLAATKIHIPTVHIESGLRSFNRKMPEEINRLVADHCSDRLYAPTPKAMSNLSGESLAERSILSGDVMRDAVQHNIEIARSDARPLDFYGVRRKGFGLVTVHRPVNTDGESLQGLLDSLKYVADNHIELLFPVHPRTRAALESTDFSPGDHLRLVEPVPYLDVINLIESSAVVITDSGGMQKEAAFLGTPCLTIRDETEWTETIDLGVNRLVGDNGAGLESAMQALRDPDEAFSESVKKEMTYHYGNGQAADLIVEDCLRWVSGP